MYQLFIIQKVQYVFGLVAICLFKQFMSHGKTIVVLAFLIIIENFLKSAVGFVDTLFISQLGLHEVAAVGVSNTILNIYFAVFLAIAAAAVMIARAVLLYWRYRSFQWVKAV